MSQDHRVYVVDKLWEVRLNTQDSGFNCHMLEPGKEYYHRISAGEIFLSHDNESYCLNCAIKKGILSSTRPSLAEPKYTFIDAKINNAGEAEILKLKSEFTEDLPKKDESEH